MAKQENNIFKNIRLAVSAIGVRLFRINTGRAWTGNKITKLPDGSIRIYDPRPFSTGTPKGYADGTGWYSVVITPDMIGQTRAIFVAIEAKTPTGRVSKEQQNFIDQVLKAGGIAGVARSPEDAVDIINRLK